MKLNNQLAKMFINSFLQNNYKNKISKILLVHGGRAMPPYVFMQHLAQGTQILIDTSECDQKISSNNEKKKKKGKIYSFISSLQLVCSALFLKILSVVHLNYRLPNRSTCWA